jgi:PPM family protein phosphatase
VDVTEATELRCPGCQAALEQGDRFCEQCGARLMDDEPSMSERIEVDLAVAAAVSDRGRVHRRNEDAFGLEVIAERRVAAVVCDGISSASAGDTAARCAAEAAATVLTAGLTDPALDTGATISEAIRAANSAVEQVPWTTRTGCGTPSCTLVCALYCDEEIAIGSVGDSRAYWIGPDGTSQLTVDDSWAEEQAEEGRLSFTEALKDPRSHSITHWIGADAPERPPRIGTFRPDSPGRLLLCTDGLWNYLAAADELSELIDRLPAGASAAAVARALVDLALVRGGRDNITVSVIDTGGALR